MAGEIDYQAVKVQIYQWAYRLLQNDHDALDATQSVLLKVLNARPALPERRTAWLRRVTVNHCIDQIRRRRHVSIADEGALRLREDLPDAERAERKRRVSAALQMLTDPQRLVLIAKTFDGETFQHISESLNIAVSTAKTHYLRALRKMRDLLADLEEQ